MNFKLEVPTALEYFESLVQSDAHFPLLEAATSLAQDEYPELDIQEVLDHVDQLGGRLKQRLPSDAGALQKLRLLNQFFFDELGFGGNLNDYYDPDNSFLHVVLRTRRGIPISLAVLWLELAAGLGLEAQGVSFPGHFLVKVRLPHPHDGMAVIDPFSGRSLGKEDLMERLMPLYNESGLVRNGEVSDDLLKQCLRTATPREIMARMLRNLEEVYVSHNDAPRLALVKKRLQVLIPEAPEVG
ncbi:transglutaminase [Limnohabitans sp. TS-CS-82]|jgi:regulator of sirC expression with transglutaminase-like and TPR domain|nr:transglutaminase [Limnohabitans sp. TS-CS-82]